MYRINLNEPSIDKSEIEAVIKVLKSKHLERGNVTLELEKELKNKFNVKYAIVVTNATSALFIALIAAGISKYDEVITSPLSFIATVNAILMCGAKPVFVDINSENFNIDISKIEKKITKKTKAILTVDLYGNPVEYSKLLNLAKKYNLLIISDSSQAIGASYYDKFITEYADITIFSFFNSKNITSGEGGALLTNNESIAEKVNILINHGQKRGTKYNYLSLGWNFRPTDIQSAIILQQLKKLSIINKKRIENANYLINHLRFIKNLKCPFPSKGSKHVYNLFTIRIIENDFRKKRDFLKNYLNENNIQAEVIYPKPLYEYPHTYTYKDEEFPVVEKIVQQILSIPVHQNLKKSDLDYIIKLIKSI